MGISPTTPWPIPAHHLLALHLGLHQFNKHSSHFHPVVNPIWSPIVTRSSLNIQWIEPPGMKQQSRGSVEYWSFLYTRCFFLFCLNCHSFAIKQRNVARLQRNAKTMFVEFEQIFFEDFCLYSWVFRFLSFFEHTQNSSCYVLPSKKFPTYCSNL